MDQKDDPDVLKRDDTSTGRHESVTIDIEDSSNYHENINIHKETEKIESHDESVKIDTDTPNCHNGTDKHKERKESVTIDTEDAPKYHEDTYKHKETKNSLIIDIDDALQYDKDLDKHKKTKMKVKDKLDKTKNSKAFFRRYFIYMGITKNTTTDEESDYDPETRNSFVAWVFLTVFICICINGIVAATVRYSTTWLPEMIRDYMFFFNGLAACFMGIVFCMNIYVVYYACYKKPPCPWICLGVACLCYTIALSIITLQYASLLVLVAIVTTALVCLMCFTLAWTSFDFTKYSIYVIVFFLVSLVISSVMLVLRFTFNIYLKPLHIGFLVVAVFGTAVALIIEMQMILGGKSMEFEEDDIGLPAFMMYVSVVILFIQLLRLCGLLELFDDFFDDD